MWCTPLGAKSMRDPLNELNVLNILFEGQQVAHLHTEYDQRILTCTPGPRGQSAGWSWSESSGSVRAL